MPQGTSSTRTYASTQARKIGTDKSLTMYNHHTQTADWQILHAWFYRYSLLVWGLQHLPRHTCSVLHIKRGWREKKLCNTACTMPTEMDSCMPSQGDGCVGRGSSFHSAPLHRSFVRSIPRLFSLLITVCIYAYYTFMPHLMLWVCYLYKVQFMLC